jgi:hypothetical protein
MKSAPLALTVSLLCSGPVLAAPAAALVEDVTGASAGVEFMDYVEPGKVIHLGPRDSIVLSYLYSCVRERIEGGDVTVGREQSDVRSGKVERTSTACDTGRMLLTTEIASQSAGTLFRSLESRSDQSRSPPAPQFTLYGLSPMVELRGGGGTLEIARIDRNGEHYALKIGTPHSPHNSFYDLATVGMTLSPGGVYRAAISGQTVTFKIDPSAEPGKTPIIGRLLRFDRVL